MKRASVAAALIVAMATLSGCGGSSEYCDTVTAEKESLNSFGDERTNEAYLGYSEILKKVAADSPSEVKKAWTTLYKMTDGVLAAQKSVGLKLEEMTDAKKVGALSEAELKKLNDAYKAFNGTTKERAAVVKNVKQECELALK